MSARMRCAISGSSSGVNLLNKGAMTVGKSHKTRKLKKTHTPHAHQVQLGPVLAMIHSTAAARGRPSATDTSKPLSASTTKRRGVTETEERRVGKECGRQG